MPTHACIDPRVLGVSTSAWDTPHALRLECWAKSDHKL